MRLVLWMVFFVVTSLGCNQPAEKKTESVESAGTSKQQSPKPFFEYDEIDHYFNDFDKSNVRSLYNNQADSIKREIIIGEIPRDISDLSFINQLEKTGYNKSVVDKNKFKDIDNIFAEKQVGEIVATGCINIYRDILIFKKNTKVVGMAKVCFDCKANRIRGTSSNTETFGQDGDYERLEKLLRK